MDPVARNRAAYQEKDHKRYLYDYFGPSIDTGFRVMGKCTPRYFTLSVEVTLAMIGRSKALGKDEADFHVKDLVLLHFDELKGVWHGRSYPVVAIDLEYDDPVNEAHALISPRGSRRQLLKLCRACYKDDLWPSWLYLPESNDDHFKTVPPDRLGEIATTSPEGVESEAGDEPEDTVDLAPDAPLGETRYKTGVETLELPAGLNSGEAEVRLRGAIQKKLDDDEYIARIRMTRRRASPRPGSWIYTAHWISNKGKPTDSTAPTNIPYTPHPFDNP